ncbi:MAG: hypothetical protein AAGG81_09225 [Chlamydiota bacterium]
MTAAINPQRNVARDRARRERCNDNPGRRVPNPRTEPIRTGESRPLRERNITRRCSSENYARGLPSTILTVSLVALAVFALLPLFIFFL